MTSVVLVPRGGCASSTQHCAHCREPIPGHRHRRARYCRASCRITAAQARRAGAGAIPAPSPQPIARPRPGPMLALLVGLLAGILIGFSVEHPAELPFAVVDAQAATELRAQLADVDGKQLDMNFWLTLCRGHSPLCAAYVARLVQANAAFLRQPLFCPQDVRIGHIERRLTEDLAWAKDKPEILKAKPAAFAAAAWNLIMPCGGKPWIDQDKPEVEPAQKKKARD
jgi:hypothetical protein